MTIVEAWQLWPLWRLLVWAAVGATLLAFAIPSPSPQPQTVMPPLPPPRYLPPVSPSPTVAPAAGATRMAAPPTPSNATDDPEVETPRPAPKRVISLSPISRPELDATGLPGAKEAGLPAPHPELKTIEVSPPAGLAPSIHPELDGVGSGVALVPRGPKARADLDGIRIDPGDGALAPASHPELRTLNNPP